jgi:protein TonB
MSHVDILDQKEGLGRPFIGSVIFHVGLGAAIAGGAWVTGSSGNRVLLGDPNGGRMGSVIVNPVNIPLPNRGAQTNPVASDTKSQLPTPPPPKKAPPKAPPIDAKAIPIPSKKATAKQQMPSWYHPELAQNNKFKQDVKPNQLTSGVGTALSSPMMQIPGGGGVGLTGTNSPFGTQFGAYADLLMRQVGRYWNRPSVNVSGVPRAIVSFTLHKDGTITDVRISQKSGIPQLDFSAERAIRDAAPFPAFPAGFNKTETGIDFVFELSR